MRSAFVYILLIFMLCGAQIVSTTTAQAGDSAGLTVIQDVDSISFAHRFDVSALRALGETSFVTSTIWTDGTVEFTGVTVTALLHHLGIAQGAIELTAANDYFVEIPVSELGDHAALLAYKTNGKIMGPREKGPLWLVYPYDSDVKYQSETFYSRSIWQVVQIKILP